jgi:hypothetical protein
MTDLIAKFIVAASVQYLRQTNSGRGTPMLMSWRIYRNRQAAQQVLLDYTCLGPSRFWSDLESEVRAAIQKAA